MERITTLNLPSSQSAYRMQDGTIWRVQLDLITQPQDAKNAEFLEAETSAIRINEDGSLVMNGEDTITLPPQRVRIPLHHVRRGHDDVKPGWVKDEHDFAKRTASAGKGNAFPKNPNEGDIFIRQGQLYRYTLGLYETCRRLRVADLDKAPVEDLDPSVIGRLAP